MCFLKKRRTTILQIVLFTLFSITVATQGIQAQTNISFIGAASGPATSGPTTTPQVITFYKNAATASSPAITATFTYTKQNYLTTEDNPTVPALTFGTNAQTSKTNPLLNKAVGNPTYDLMNAISGPANNNFTVCATCTNGTGIDVTQNRAVALFNSVDGFIDDNGNTTIGLTDKVYMGDLTITFSQPVNNPMLHVVGLGGQFSYNTEIPTGSGNFVNYAHGFTTEYELATAGINLMKISGNSVLSVTGNAILNTAPNLGAPTTASLISGVSRQAATGTIEIQGMGITTVTFKIYMRGDAGVIYDKNNAVIPAQNGNIVRWTSQKDFTPLGQTDKLYAFSGDKYLLGMSLSECDLANASSDVTVNCTTPSATLTARGGGTYAWSTAATTASITVTPATTTTYTVTVTGTNGCTTTDAVIVTANKTVPTANAGADVTVSCATPSTTLTATGGGTYVWSTAATTASITVTPATTTTYTVTVTDANGCTATDGVVVTVNKVPATISLAADTTICAGTTITLTANLVGITTEEIKFVYFSTHQTVASAIYGTPDGVLGTVTNAQLTASNTKATLSVTMPAAPASKTYHVYAILATAPTDAVCQSFGHRHVIADPSKCTVPCPGKVCLPITIVRVN